MSMLAEPRRKKAWVLNPRGSQWSEDDTKLGQKMLEQMGWSKGRGLGKEMKGITEHIRPSVQNDSRGLGFEGKSDEWVAHLDDFNDLLLQLQEDQNDAAKDTAQKPAKSLEEKSKKSRARVHYHKFTRGKDLSRCSSQDLACILGGRAEGAASQPVTPVSSRPPSPPAQADSEPVSEAETERPAAEVQSSHGYTTINTGKSVQDYFAEKMRKIKFQKLQQQREHHVSSDVGGVEVAPALRCSQHPSQEKSSKKKSKKKRSQHARLDGQAPSPDADVMKQSDLPRRKKKTRTDADRRCDGEAVTDECGILVPAETDSKKPSKKRKNESDIGCGESALSACVVENSGRKKHKKKKSNRGEE